MLSDKSKGAFKRYLRDEYRIEAEDILRVYEDEWDYGMCETCSYPETGICIEYTDLNHMKEELREADFDVVEFLREYVTGNSD